MRHLLPLLCCLAAASEPDAASALKAVHAEAMKAGELWTILQCEAWARLHPEAKLARPAFGEALVVGDARWACAGDIVRHWELADGRLMALADGRLFAWSEDGRPLALPTRLPLGGDDVGLSVDGAWFGQVDKPGRRSTALACATGALPGGKALLRADVPCDAFDHITDAVVVADDGSALACALGNSRIGGTRVIVVGPTGPRTVTELREAQAVGPRGAWVAGRGRGGATVLMRGEEQVPLRDLARGPGVTVVLAEDGAVARIAADGALANYAIPAVRGARLTVLGRWLARSGTRAAESDPLATAPAGARPFVELYRWRDLAAADAATAPQPALTLDVRLAVVADEFPALYLWTGDRIAIADLTVDDPRDRPLCTAAGPVAAVHSDRQRTVVQLADGRFQVFDAAGKELWLGAADDLDLVTPDLALARSGPRGATAWSLVRLAVDPVQRSQVALDLPADTAWSVAVDRGLRRIVARTTTRWIELDPATGKQRRNGDENDPLQERPRVSSAQPGAIGRWMRQGARLLPKRAVESWPPLQRLAPVDAWLVGRTPVVLDADQRVWGLKKPGELVDLGFADGADHLCLASGALAAEGNGRLVAVVAGAALAPPPANAKHEALPSGTWRIGGRMDFIVPGTGQVKWSSARTGCTPLRLRSPPTPNLWVVTGSIVFELPPTALKGVTEPYR